jgi:hypothetical protein
MLDTDAVQNRLLRGELTAAMPVISKTVSSDMRIHSSRWLKTSGAFYNDCIGYPCLDLVG